MTVQVLPNVEAIVSTFLQAQPEMIALIGTRTYTAIPGNATYPLCRVTQFDDVKVTHRPLWVVRASVQIEGFGGSKAEALNIVSTAEACIAERLEGAHAGGVVTGITWGSKRDLPDSTFSPAKPRWLTTAYITVHP